MLRQQQQSLEPKWLRKFTVAKGLGQQDKRILKPSGIFGSKEDGKLGDPNDSTETAKLWLHRDRSTEQATNHVIVIDELFRTHVHKPLRGPRGVTEKGDFRIPPYLNDARTPNSSVLNSTGLHV